MLPVQILLFSMESINAVVDGVFAGRFIDASAVGVVGLYYPMVNILSAIGAVLLGGSAVLCGNYMGRGEREKTEGVFSLTLTRTFVIGLVLTLTGLVIPGKLAVLLGANDALKDDLMRYILGYAIGILPMLLAQQMAAFLQLERRNARVYAGIAGMILSNVFFDILLEIGRAHV